MTDPKQDVQDVRAQFEAAASDYSMALERDSSGVYVDPDTQNAWFFYQAALQSPAVRELVEAAEECEGTELGEMGCIGSMAPCEHALGRLFTALRTLGAGHVE